MAYVLNTYYEKLFLKYLEENIMVFFQILINFIVFLALLKYKIQSSETDPEM